MILKSTALAFLTLVFSPSGITAERLVFYGGTSVTTYLSSPGSKPYPVSNENSWGGGEVHPQIIFELGHLPEPPPFPPTPPGQPPKKSDSRGREIGDQDFSFQTKAGHKFNFHLRMRKSDTTYSGSITCTTPDFNSTRSEFVSEGVPAKMKYISVNCPRVAVDEKHYAYAEFFLSVDPKYKFQDQK